MNLLLFAQFIMCCFNIILASDDEPIVRVTNGLLQGTYLETKRGRKILGFMGIPYAKPPVGYLRFQPPVPFENWDGVRPAMEKHNVCIQNDMFSILAMMKVKMSEDCLYLNVYTPKIDKNKPLPVMVFIHGGAFHSGHGSRKMFGPEIILDKDIVFVAFNYRLGPFGFLTSGDEVVPGNMGLKDQYLALKWIKENIVNFGGDPNSITIFGESAGAASVHLQMLSPLSKGLFHGAISQSGTALGQWALLPIRIGVGLTKKLSTLLNCPTKYTQEMINCLQNAKAEDINNTQKEFAVWDIDPIIIFGPVIEPAHDGAFIADTPENIMKNGLGSDVPWINGITTEEGLIRSAALLINPALLQDYNEKFDNIAHTLFFLEKDKKTDNLARKVKEFYFGEGIIDASKEKELTALYSDSLFAYSGHKAVTLHKTYLEQPVYNYLFGYRGQFSVSTVFSDSTKDFGVSHGDDLIYFFPLFDMMMPNIQLPDEYHQMSDTFLNLWINFAKFRNPTPEGSKIKWDPVATKSNEYLRIDSPEDLFMEKEMFQERMKFWESLESLLNEAAHMKDEL